eukprot:1468792-Lingulodinium_polyedra.AAC.1
MGLGEGTRQSDLYIDQEVWLKACADTPHLHPTLLEFLRRSSPHDTWTAMGISESMASIPVIYGGLLTLLVDRKLDAT